MLAMMIFTPNAGATRAQKVDRAAVRRRVVDTDRLASWRRSFASGLIMATRVIGSRGVVGDLRHDRRRSSRLIRQPGLDRAAQEPDAPRS
jgi:hypothetical protein